MIAGEIVLEDQTIRFILHSDNMVDFTVIEYNPVTRDFITERKNVEGHKFFKALAIAVHNDGMPDYKKDYPDAESIMGDIRWIP